MTYALVTGGAKRLGLAICKHLSKIGYNIILHYNQSEVEANEAATIIRKSNMEVELFKADLSKIDEVKKLSEFCKQFQLSVVINNASAFKNDSMLSDHIGESLTEHLMVNYISRVVIIGEAKKSLQKGKKLDIINLLDYGIYKVPHNFFSYHMANKMMVAFTQLAARQLAPDATVNSIALGQTLKNDKQSQQNFDSALNSTLLGCSSTTEELLRAIDFILSVNSMTGQTIVLDGGMSISNDKYR